jgi:hypothetical protein
MTHKPISQMGWADKNPNDFSFLSRNSPRRLSIFSLNCDGLLMGVALSPLDGPASIISKQHRLITTSQMKNKQTNKQRGAGSCV